MTHLAWIRPLLLSSALCAAACSASHAPEAATPPGDAGTAVDAPATPDPIVPPVTPSACGTAAARGVSVEVVDVEPAPESGSCIVDGAHLSGVLERVERLTDREGVRLRLEACPDGVLPCPCDVTVTGVGSDAVDESFVGQRVGGRFDGSMLSLLLECDERCIPTPVLIAEDGYPSSPRSEPVVDIAIGDRVCYSRGDDGCYSERRALTVAPRGSTERVAIDEGEATLLPPIYDGVGVRVVNLRSAENACGEGIPEAPSAAWAAWAQIVGTAVTERTH